MKFTISVRNRELSQEQADELSLLGFTFDEVPADIRRVDQSPDYCPEGDIEKEMSSLESLLVLTKNFGTIALDGTIIELLRYRDQWID